MTKQDKKTLLLIFNILIFASIIMLINNRKICGLFVHRIMEIIPVGAEPASAENGRLNRIPNHLLCRVLGFQDFPRYKL